MDGKDSSQRWISVTTLRGWDLQTIPSLGLALCDLRPGDPPHLPAFLVMWVSAVVASSFFKIYLFIFGCVGSSLLRTGFL